MSTRPRLESSTAGVLGVVLAYALFAGLWILLSDHLMAQLFADRDLLMQVSMIKGGFFVAVTTLLLYFLVHRLAARIQLAHRRESEAQAGQQRSQYLLSTIVENLDDPIFAKDIEGRYLLFNGAASRVVGKPAAEVLGRDDRSIFPAAQAELLMAADRRVTTDGHTETDEQTLDTAQGIRTFLTTKGPLREADGGIIGLFGIARDITRDKRTAEELQRSENRFRALVEQSTAGIYIIQDGWFRYVNPGYAAIFGYASADDIIDKVPVSDLVSPEYRERVAENIRRRTEGEVAEIRYSFTGRRRDGSRVDVEAHGRAFDYEGRPAVIGLVLDVTSRHASETALRQSEKRFEDIVRASADWIWEVDAEARYTYVSDSVEALLGYTPVEILGKTPFDLMPPDEAARVAAEFATIVAHKTMFRDLDNINLHKDGSLRYVQTNGMPILAADGTLLGYRGLDRDITEKVLAEHALRMGETRYRQLFDASHDALMTLAPPSWHLYSVNPATLAMFGAASMSDLAAAGLWAISPERQPDGRSSEAATREWIAQAMREGAAHFEWQYRRFDGSSFDADVLLTRVGDDDSMVLVTVRDISARKAADAELKARTAELERFNRATVGREIDMIAMKRRINSLSQELGREAPYPLAFLPDEERKATP